MVSEVSTCFRGFWLQTSPQSLELGMQMGFLPPKLWCTALLANVGWIWLNLYQRNPAKEKTSSIKQLSYKLYVLLRFSLVVHSGVVMQRTRCFRVNVSAKDPVSAVFTSLRWRAQTVQIRLSVHKCYRSIGRLQPHSIECTVAIPVHSDIV